MKCDNCIHYECCKRMLEEMGYEVSGELKDEGYQCPTYQDKSHYIKLPLKPGDWVYALWEVPTAAKYIIYTAEVKDISVHQTRNRTDIEYNLEPIEFRGRHRLYCDEDFGKTVFLTKESAEAALKERSK